MLFSLIGSSIRQVHAHGNLVGFQWQKQTPGKPCASVSLELQLSQGGCCIVRVWICVSPQGPGTMASPSGLWLQLVTPTRDEAKPYQESWAHVSKKQRERERFEQSIVIAGGFFQASSKLGLFIGSQTFSACTQENRCFPLPGPMLEPAKPAGRVHKQGSRDIASCLWLLWAGDTTLSTPHTSLASLPGYQTGSQRAACFSCAVGTAAASAHKPGTGAGACKRFGSNGVHGAWTTELGSEPGLSEPEQVGALTTRLLFIFQH